MSFSQKIILSMCIILCSSLVIASTEDTRKPITIEADRAVLDEKKQISIYTGNVILKQGGIEVKADTITVYTKEGQLQRVVAEGNPVHYQQQQNNNEDIRGVSQRMEYETETNRVLLLGDAELWQGGNRFSGKRIQYDPGQEKVIATGDPNATENGAQRVKIILQPQSSAKQQEKP
jgi:lipopolysaccharide export system protein LptA